ncbi:MAG TPA: MFS transporter, partial [Blastocatellia bacterium]|nr:MFS transporter [Blastocatellia bacterium]
MSDSNLSARPDSISSVAADSDLTASSQTAGRESAAPAEPPPAAPSRLALLRKVGKPLAAVIIGSLILRLAAQTMSQMLQFYFAKIDRDYFSLSNTVTGLVTASFFVTELLGSPILGAMSDKLGRKKFILLGPLLGAMAVQITAMTMAIWLLVFTRLLEGLSTASSIPATLGFISDATTNRPNLRARIMGLFEITFIGGVALGAVIGGYLWKYFSNTVVVGGLRLITPAFSMNGVIYLLAFVIFMWGLTNVPLATDSPSQVGIGSTESPLAAPAAVHIREKLKDYLIILKSKPVLDFAPAWLAVNSVIGMWTNHSARLLTGKQRHTRQVLMGTFGPLRFGYGLAAVLIVFAFGVLVWSLFIGRYRKTGVMLVATSGLFLTLLMVYFYNHGARFSPTTNHLLIGGMLAGLLTMSGFTPAALTHLADISELHAADRGSIMGLYTVFLGIGQVIGTSLGGFFAQWRGVD